MTATKKVRCATCGYALRRYRPEKRCPTCGQTKAAQDFLHARSRNDHLGSQCRDCQRERQRTSYRKEKFEARMRHFPDKPGPGDAPRGAQPGCGRVPRWLVQVAPATRGV
jgi:hypothetical protein